MKIGIIGGGITGLTTSLALRKMGIASTVYERANQLSEIGAGVWLQPNAIKVLDWLGIKKAIQKDGMELDRMEITNQQLVPFKKIKGNTVQDESGNKTVAIHRGKLQNVLYELVSRHNKIELGMTYQGHELMNDQAKIHFSGGEAIVDLVLGADGIGSRVRKAIFPGYGLRTSGQICWRGIADISLDTALKKIGREAWGNQIRFGFSQISDGEVYWFAVVKESSLVNKDATNVKALLQERFLDFHPVVQEIIGNTNDQQIHRADLSDLERLKHWSSHNTCLMGDAAHATTPNMGQGACQGIEDAYYMSTALSAELNPVKAFRSFESMRRKKVDYVVSNSWRFGKMAHSKVGQAVIRSIMKLTPEKVLNQQMNRLYQVEGL